MKTTILALVFTFGMLFGNTAIASSQQSKLTLFLQNGKILEFFTFAEDTIDDTYLIELTVSRTQEIELNNNIDVRPLIKVEKEVEDNFDFDTRAIFNEVMNYTSLSK